MTTDVFHIAPSTSRAAPTTLGILVLVVVLVMSVVVFITYRAFRGASGSTFEITNAGLTLRGDIYGRTIPAAELVPAEARVLDIRTGPYAPAARVGGTSVPGYLSGWFRLRNGHKALLYVTDQSRVVLVPTTAGYDVLLSVAESDAFVARLRALP